MVSLNGSCAMKIAATHFVLDWLPIYIGGIFNDKHLEVKVKIFTFREPVLPINLVYYRISILSL